MPAVAVRPAWQTYADDLIVLGHGLALWEPAPLHYYDKVNIGDVGYIRDGRFHLLFSAALPLGNRQLGVDVPRGFVPIGPGPIVTDQPRLPGALHTEHVEQYGGGLRASSDISCIQAGTNLRFQSSSKQGAILLTKYKTFRTNAERLGFFKDYMLRNYHSWVEFANQLGHMVNCEDVLLVTGHDMTLDFAMVAFSSNSRQIGMEFEAGLPAVASAAASVWGTWRTTMSVHHNCGPQHREPPRHAQPLPIEASGSPSDSQPDYNQCVFLRGYRIRKRAGLIPTVIKAAAGPHDLGSGRRFDEHGSSVCRQDRSDSGSDVVIVSDTPSFIDPLDPLFRYIFEHSSAEVAVLHDLDLLNLMEATGTSSADIETLIAKLSPNMIEVEPNGTACVKLPMNATLCSLPESTTIQRESQSGRETDDVLPEDPAVPRSPQLGERPPHSAVGYGPSSPADSLVRAKMQPGTSPSYSLHDATTAPWSQSHTIPEPHTSTDVNDRASLQLSLSHLNRSTTSLQSRVSISTCPSSHRTSMLWNPGKLGALRRFGRDLERRAESVVIRAYLRRFEKMQPILLRREGQFTVANETEVRKHCVKLVDLCVAGMSQEIKNRAFTLVLSGFRLPLRRLWSTHVAEAISKRELSKVHTIFQRGFFPLLEGNTSRAYGLVVPDMLRFRCPAVTHEIAVIISHLALRDLRTDPDLDPRPSVDSLMHWSSQGNYVPKILPTLSAAVIRAGFFRLAKYWGDNTLPYWDLRGLECLETALADVSRAQERHGNLGYAKDAKLLLRKLKSKRLILGDEDDDVLGAGIGHLEAQPSFEVTSTEFSRKAYGSTSSLNQFKHTRDRHGSVDFLDKRLLPAGSSNRASWGDHKKEKAIYQT